MSTKIYLLFIGILVATGVLIAGPAQAQPPCGMSISEANTKCFTLDEPQCWGKQVKSCEGNCAYTISCEWIAGDCIYESTINEEPCAPDQSCSGGDCIAADGNGDGDGGEGTVCGGPLVPCGGEPRCCMTQAEKNNPDQYNCSNDTDVCEPPCQLCHFFYLFENILDFVLICLVPPIAVLMLIIGGLMFIFSYGGIPGIEAAPTQITRARKVIGSVLLGLLIIYGSWLIINAFLTMVGVEDWTGLDRWFELTIDCQGIKVVKKIDPFGVPKQKLNQAIDQGALETIDINQTFSD